MQQVISDLKSMNFAPVMPFNVNTDRLIPIDLSAGNKNLTDDILADTSSLSLFIEDQLKSKSAKYGIGGYGEHRKVYAASKLFDGGSAGQEPRRLHLGTDIWGKAYTPVMAPMDGIVHSFAFNNQPGDYGATIIITHHLEDSTCYTLYGHLSLSSLKNLGEGERIEKGDVFAELGIPYENGGWPPHLHFQLILDMKGYKGDYPGVCKFSEKENWLANSPDPDIILQWNKHLS